MKDYITSEEAMKLIKNISKVPVSVDTPLEKLHYSKYWLVIEYRRKGYRTWPTRRRFSDVDHFKKWINTKNQLNDFEYVNIYGVTDKEHYDNLMSNSNKEKSYSIPVSIFNKKPPRGSLKYRLKMFLSRGSAVDTYNSLVQAYGTDTTSDTYVKATRPPTIDNPYGYYWGTTIYVNMESEDFVPIVMMHISNNDNVTLQVFEGE